MTAKRKATKAIGYIDFWPDGPKDGVKAECQRCRSTVSGKIDDLIEFSHEHVCDPLAEPKTWTTA